MPRVLRHTPRWLERPAPGFELFHTEEQEKLANGKTIQGRPGASRTIANRGTEVFVAVGNQLRWADLLDLQEQDYHRRKGDIPHDETGETTANAEWDAYRILKVPGHRDILQLMISPQENYLAILTSHTVHVALLPDSAQLGGADQSPLRLKTWQVGPTAHVLERSPVVSALWHPLAKGPCLVTVTEDAIVRMWELDPNNRNSFDNPALPLDLRKMSDSSSSSQDYSPSKYGTNTAFSPDQVDMEVATSCFGGLGAADEADWAPTTLWVAMRNGDIYALCPFLPSRWVISTSQLSDLAASIDSSNSDTEQAQSQAQIELSQGQSAWVADLFNQPRPRLREDNLDVEYCLYERPQQPGPVPALQGPYHFEPDADQVFDVTDIFAIAPRIAHDENVELNGLGDDESKPSSLPAAVICLATSDGLVHVCLDINGTQAKWLPGISQASEETLDDTLLPSLLLTESVKVCDPDSSAWPVFSPNTGSRFSVYVSHTQGISHVSPVSSLQKLGSEVDGGADQSSEFRLRLLAQSGESEVQPIIQFSTAGPTLDHDTTACVHVRDSDLGDFLLAVSNGQPHAASLDFTNLELLFEGDDVAYDSDDEFNALYPREVRNIYQVPPELFAGTTLPLFSEDQKNGTARQLMEKELRFAPATVTLMMEAHRLLGSETGKLQDAVSSLFQRCERMQDELKAQLQRVGEISGKIDAVLDDNADVPEDEEDDMNVSIQRRVEDARSRNESLQERYNQLRDKFSKLDHRPLNDKERPWIREIDKLEQLVTKKDEDKGSRGDDGGQSQRRFDEIKTVRDDLVRRSEQLKGGQEDEDADEASPRKQRQRMDQVNTMLERETALVSATAAKLEQLKMSA